MARHMVDSEIFSKINVCKCNFEKVKNDVKDSPQKNVQESLKVKGKDKT